MSKLFLNIGYETIYYTKVTVDSYESKMDHEVITAT